MLSSDFEQPLQLGRIAKAWRTRMRMAELRRRAVWFSEMAGSGKTEDNTACRLQHWMQSAGSVAALVRSGAGGVGCGRGDTWVWSKAATTRRSMSTRESRWTGRGEGAAQ